MRIFLHIFTHLLTTFLHTHLLRILYSFYLHTGGDSLLHDTRHVVRDVREIKIMC